MFGLLKRWLSKKHSNSTGNLQTVNQQKRSLKIRVGRKKYSLNRFNRKTLLKNRRFEAEIVFVCSDKSYLWRVQFEPRTVIQLISHMYHMDYPFYIVLHRSYIYDEENWAIDWISKSGYLSKNLNGVIVKAS